MSLNEAEWLAETYGEALRAEAEGRAQAAEKLCRQIRALLPVHGGALRLLSRLANQRGDESEALAWLEILVEIEPNAQDALIALAQGLKQSGGFEASRKLYERAITLAPEDSGLRVNYANLLQDLGRFEEALGQCVEAVRLAPAYPLARYNLGMAQLLEGDFAQGWENCEWRWKAEGLGGSAKSLPAPAWQGEPLAGKTILLWAEQGLGDTLQFCRYAPLLKDRGARILLCAPRSLHPVLATLRGLSGLFAEGDALPPFDFHLPLLGLPRWLTPSQADIPACVPYLASLAERRDLWRQRLSHHKGMKIGLCWRGNPHHRNDASRSLSLKTLAPLLEINSVSWISLQLDATKEERTGLAFDAAPFLTDFGETAALLDEIDLLIGVDTSAIHLAGALNRPVWTLLPFVPDWRWLRNRSDSPWYPSMRLLRQPSLGDWPAAIALAKEALLRRLGVG